MLAVLNLYIINITCYPHRLIEKNQISNGNKTEWSTLIGL